VLEALLEALHRYLSLQAIWDHTQLPAIWQRQHLPPLLWMAGVMPNTSQCKITHSTRFARHV